MYKKLFSHLNDPIDSDAKIEKLDEYLFLFIHRNHGSSTSIIRFSADLEIDFFHSFPMKIVHTYAYEGHIVLVGQTADKQYVLSIDKDCRVNWTNPLNKDYIHGHLPTVRYDEHLTLANYDEIGKINLVSLNIKKQAYFNAFSRKVPANKHLRFAGNKDYIQACWYEDNYIYSFDPIDGYQDKFHTGPIAQDKLGNDDVRVAFCKNYPVLTWKDQESFWIKTGMYEQDKKAIAKAGLGVVVPIAGPKIVALVIDRQFSSQSNWGNMIYIDGQDPIILDGFIYQVCQWNNRIAIVQKDQVIAYEIA